MSRVPFFWAAYAAANASLWPIVSASDFLSCLRGSEHDGTVEQTFDNFLSCLRGSELAAVEPSTIGFSELPTRQRT